MFETHKLNENGFKTVNAFKTKLAEGVRAAMELLPDGREKSIFVTKIEEAAFFGTKAIAAEKTNHTETTGY